MAADRDREAIVRPGDVLPEDPRAQMRAAFRNLSTTLQAAGATWGDVVALTTYHVGVQSQIQALVEIRNEFVREPYPAWTGVGVTGLHSGAVVEISLVAELPRSD